MVAQTVSQSPGKFEGLRPFNAARDLSAVALLLEEAFRDDLGFLHAWSRVPILREVGARIWAAGFTPAFPDPLLGCVWEQDGRIIGNVTLSPDESRRRTWLISNVAVEPRFRRQGIARQMMLAAIDQATERGANWVILNVRPYNLGAIALYRDLGFDQVDTEMGYILRHPALTHPPALALRRLQGDEFRAAFEIARAGMSEQLKTFRPIRPSEFVTGADDRISERVTDFFLVQRSERWGYFEDKRLIGTLTLHAQRVGSPHSFDVRVEPAARGRLEEGIISFLFERLRAYPERDVVTRLLTSHTQLVEAIGREKFIPTRGLMLMAKLISR